MNSSNLIVWTDEYSVGISGIDNQHKKIIQLINMLSVEEGHEKQQEALHGALHELSDYVKVHLEYEEQLLERFEYPALVDHKKLHEGFLETISDLMYKVVINEEGSYKKLIDFLQEWWDHHILMEDMKYSEFFLSKGVSS